MYLFYVDQFYFFNSVNNGRLINLLFIYFDEILLLLFLEVHD